MSNTFEISVNKACPACDISCPNFEFDSTTMYGESYCNGRIAVHEFFCKNGELCSKLWCYLKKHNSALEGH